MSHAVDLPEVQAPPDREAFLASQGMLRGRPVPARVLELLDRAFGLYVDLANPRGLWDEVARDEFEDLYRGDGLNEPRTPLEQIVPRAERLALFAVTLGQALSTRIDRLFAANEPALGYLLDAVASERADRAAALLAARYGDEPDGAGSVSPASRVLPYSPGYCGWHITGQRRLFERLRPESIGITLGESCLMQPLKSVSGVLVAGPKEVHAFDDDFEFCEGCATHACRARIAAVTGSPGGAPWTS